MLYEVITVDPAYVRRLMVLVKNRITSYNVCYTKLLRMRTSLVASLLETVARNIAYRSRDLSLFELRPVFLPQAGEELPQEQGRLTAVICGRRDPEGWAQGKEAVDFFDLKGVLEGLVARVITSYSIHYTKLYDKISRTWCTFSSEI